MKMQIGRSLYTEQYLRGSLVLAVKYLDGAFITVIGPPPGESDVELRPFPIKLFD